MIIILDSFDYSAIVGGAAPVEPLLAERGRGRGVFHGIVA